MTLKIKKTQIFQIWVYLVLTSEQPKIHLRCFD
jgi:hypothetical protein